VVVLFGCVLALSSAQISTVGAVAPTMEHSLHIHNTEIGLLNTVTLLVSAFAVLPIGLLVDKTKRIPMLSISIVLWSVTTMLGALAGSYGTLLLSRVLLSQRTQFLYKLGNLQEMVEDLGKDFCASAQELGEGLSTDPAISWKIVDAAHYDLNTCLRETIILLKSFLRALPEDQVAGFEKSVAESWAAATSETSSDSATLLRHRRMAHIAGE